MVYSVAISLSLNCMSLPKCNTHVIAYMQSGHTIVNLCCVFRIIPCSKQA